MLNKNFILATLISTLLTACGGGGGTSSNSTSTTQTASAGTTQPTTTSSSTAASTYTGKKELASISSSNQKLLISSLFEVRAEIAKSSRVKPFNDIIQASLLDKDISCTNGGSVRMTGNLSEVLNTGKGTLQFTVNQCNSSGSVTNGARTIKINKFNTSTKEIIDYDITYHNFTETVDGETTTTNGTRSIINGSTYTEVISTATQKISSSTQTTQLLENNIKYRHTYTSTSTSEISVSGAFCEATNGCINVSTPIPFLISSNSSGYVQGQHILTGYANSKTRFEIVSGVLWMSIDANGDGVYEITTRY
jgi:hypothetical protein